MELGEQRVDPKLREEGAWVSDIPEMGDLRLKVRGANNKAWEKRQDALIAAVPRKMRIKGLDPSERRRINAICCRDHGLIDWENLNIDGVAVPYSKEKANELLTDPQWAMFHDAAIWACNVVGTQMKAEVEEDAGK
ncbi:MAG: hypothetical protein AB7U95_03150 [Reyranella sp.]